MYALLIHNWPFLSFHESWKQNCQLVGYILGKNFDKKLPKMQFLKGVHSRTYF